MSRRKTPFVSIYFDMFQAHYEGAWQSSRDSYGISHAIVLISTNLIRLIVSWDLRNFKGSNPFLLWSTNQSNVSVDNLRYSKTFATFFVILIGPLLLSTRIEPIWFHTKILLPSSSSSMSAVSRILSNLKSPRKYFNPPLCFANVVMRGSTFCPSLGRSRWGKEIEWEG